MRTTERQFLTPPRVATLLGVGVSKILYWIDAGELQAVNLATELGKRPRWAIALEALEEFKQRRSATPPAKNSTRRPRRPFQTRPITDR